MKPQINSRVTLGFTYLASLSLHVCFFLASNCLTHTTEIHPLTFDCMILLFSYREKLLSLLNTILQHASAISDHINPQSAKLLTSLVEG